jgi:hypothetical protein
MMIFGTNPFSCDEDPDLWKNYDLLGQIFILLSNLSTIDWLIYCTVILNRGIDWLIFLSFIAHDLPQFINIDWLIFITLLIDHLFLIDKTL